MTRPGGSSQAAIAPAIVVIAPATTTGGIAEPAAEHLGRQAHGGQQGGEAGSE